MGFVALVSAWALYMTTMIYFFQEYILSGWLLLPTQIWLTFVIGYFMNLWYVNFSKKDFMRAMDL